MATPTSPLTIAALTHTCRYCKSRAAYVSKKVTGRTTIKHYFYCEKHKTPNAIKL